MKTTNLRVEYQDKPIGIDIKKPRFSWILVSEEHDVTQKAYQIVIMQNEREVWNTGKVDSDQSILVEYAGEELQMCSHYDVQVTVYDNKGNISSAETYFETGLLSGKAFQAKWITHGMSEEETACPIFVNEFNITKEIRDVRVYATALGIYEIKINGERVGDQYFAPGWTNYKARVQYQTYQTESMKKGHNTIEIVVGNGWYKGILGFLCVPNQYGDRTAALAEIHVTYQDGSREVITTDENWKVKTGPIRSSELYMGEVIDSCFTDDTLSAAVLYEFDQTKIIAQENTPVRIIKELSVKEYLVTPKQEKVLDFGQNMTGFVRVKIKGEKGQKITIRHAETLDKEGNFYPDTLRQAISHDIFICNGEEQVFMPHFTFHGFRYICIEGIDEIETTGFTAMVLHTDMEVTGSFTCSDEAVNQLQSNIQWGQRGNFLDVPTDCPQRDERLGWTGDAQVFAGTAAYNMDVSLFFRKWLHDLDSEQTAEYGVPHVIPNILGNQPGAAAWSDAATIVPWTIYQIYGDKMILSEQYQSMKGWVDYITAQTGSNGLWQSGYQYGDWLALDKEESADRIGATDKYLVANAYYAYSTQIVAMAAGVLGNKADADEYTQLYKRIREAFNREYITQTGRLVSETQTGCILALYFGLAEDEHRDRILESLVSNIGNHKEHLATGFVGTPYFAHVLSESGAHDLAGRVFLKEDYPSWLYAVRKGATTIWERWNSILPNGDFDESGMNSLNHYAYGSIGDWMYRKLAGINQLAPGYKKILIKPQFIKGITRVAARFQSVYGWIESSWSCEDGKITVDIKIPVNTTATIWLPEKPESLEVGSGSYHYEYATDTCLVQDKFSNETTLGYLLEQKEAVEMIRQYLPEVLDGPMLELAKPMTISELNANMPEEGVQLFQMIIDQLNKNS